MRDAEDRSVSDHGSASTAPRGCHAVTITRRRPGWFAILGATAAIGLAACGGSPPAHVASVGTHRGDGGASTTTLPKGNPTQLLDEWARCMRTQGDPDQADPTVDANKVIHIGYPTGYNPKSLHGPSGTTNPCSAYLSAASSALGGQPPERDPTKMVAFSQCMRANGVPDFPDPTDIGGTYQFPIGIHPENSSDATPVPGPGTSADLNPADPTTENAAKLCAHAVGVPRWGDTLGSAPGSIVESADG
jgi:hypothetical protein